MKLIVFGKEEDPSEEMEITVNQDCKFGLKATITLSDEAPEGWCDEVRRNLTEVHYWYDQNRKYGENESAFESDIHGCGGTMKNKYISMIVVEYDTALAPGVYEYNRYDELEQAAHETGSGM